MVSYTSNNDFSTPRENKRELVVFRFVFHVQVMSDSRRRSDTDTKRARFLFFFHPRKGRNHIPLLITELVCWMHCSLVPRGYGRGRDCCVFLLSWCISFRDDWKSVQNGEFRKERFARLSWGTGTKTGCLAYCWCVTERIAVLSFTLFFHTIVAALLMISTVIHNKQSTKWQDVFQLLFWNYVW